MRLAIILFFMTGLMALPWWLMAKRYGPVIYRADRDVSSPIGIVFGAGLRRDGSPTRVLSDRVRTAVDLYQEGKVGKLLLSGSAQGSYDEPQAMAALAASLGVPQDDLLLDRGGLRTYATCARALSEYGIEEALLISQRFHLPRALAICESMGIEAAGISADGGHYGRGGRLIWNLREIPASLVALWDILTLPKPASASAIDAACVEKDERRNET